MRLSFEEWREEYAEEVLRPYSGLKVGEEREAFLRGAYRVYLLEFEEDREVVQVMAVIALVGCVGVAVWPGVFRWLIEGLRVFDRGF